MTKIHTLAPLAAVATLLMLGGVHHVPDRVALFGEIARILKPGGIFLWREPVSDFVLWRALRAVVYRLSPMLDDETERDDIDMDTLDGMRCAAAMLASVVAAVRAEVAVRSAEFEEQHYGNADESLEAARCAGNLNALRWLESLVTAPIR